MEIKDVKRSNPAQKDSPERQQDDGIEAFDPTGKARLESLAKTAERLAAASRALSNVFMPGGTNEEDLKALREVGEETNIACRELRQTLENLNALVNDLIQDTVGIVRALAVTESNTFDLNTKVDCLRVALFDKGLLDMEDIKKAFTEKVKPAIKEALAQQNQQRMDQAAAAETHPGEENC